MFSLGFLGAGQMGSAIIGGLKEKAADTECLFFDADQNRSKEVARRFNAAAEENIGAVMAKADGVIIAVKPQIYPNIAAEIAENYREGTLLLSIMAGVTVATLEENLPESAKVIRLMPNTAMAVNAGVCLLSANKNVTDAEKQRIIDLLSLLGMVKEIPEKNMNAAMALSGSGPAFFYTMIEGMMLGGIKAGLPKKDALELSAQTMLGAAEMLLATGESASVLRDQVLSPAGTTIEGVRVLEEGGFRSDVINAVEATYRRGEEMGKGRGDKA
jgi:pyrroline-5-carboxylate reductase